MIRTASLPLAVGSGNVIAVVVTAEDGERSQTYTVTVTRAGSADATLSGLSLSGMTLSPAFASGTVAYTASVGHAVTETTVTASASDAQCQRGGDAGGRRRPNVRRPGGVGGRLRQPSPSVGHDAEDWETTRTYMVTVTRAGSADASLSALSLSGVTLSPVFASGTIGAHGVGGEQRDGDDGDGVGERRQCQRGGEAQRRCGPGRCSRFGGGRWQRHCRRSHRGGW